MKKILLSLVAIFAMSVNVFAEDILWSEDFSSYAKNDVPAGGTYAYTCVGSGTKVYEEALAGGTSPELLVGKNSGSFSATIPMNGKSGELTLTFVANYDRLTVTATGATLGDKVAAGTSYSYPVTVAAGTQSITLTFTNTQSSNVRLDNLKLAAGQGKKLAGLSWGTASRTVTIGAEDNQFPTLSNANELPVSYTSSEASVATIDASGVVSLVAPGTTVISAVFDGNDQYEAQTVSYTLTVKGAPTVDLTNTLETAYTVAKALELIEAGEGLETKVYVKGIISQIDEVSTQYGNATYYISDNGTTDGQLEVFRGYGLEGEKFTKVDAIKVGDVVVVYGKLMYYNGTAEVGTGSSIASLNGVTSAIKNVTVDANAPVYNLAGQRVAGNYRGVVIVNGKKIVK